MSTRAIESSVLDFVDYGLYDTKTASEDTAEIQSVEVFRLRAEMVGQPEVADLFYAGQAEAQDIAPTTHRAVVG